MKVLSAVFSKEMVTLARRKRHFFSRGLLLGVLLATISLSWLSGLRRLYHSGFIDTSFMGRQLFLTFTITQLLAVAILMPALTAPVIAAEKDRNTLSLLLMSNLKRYNILLDKLLSRIVLIALLLLSGLPLFLALLAFGGITPMQILVSYTSIFATILFCSGIGLLFSTLLNRMHTAMIATYATIAGYFFAIIVLSETHNLPCDVEFLLPVSFSDAAYGESVSLLVLSTLVFLVSLRTCYCLLPKVTGHKRRHFLKRLSGWMNVFFERINFTGVTMMNEKDTLKGNAILWKEAHKHFFCSTTFLIRSCYALLMLSMIVLIVMREWQAATAVVTLVGAVLLAIIALLASSTAFTTEREKHSFEVLMSSPLTARDIVMAKFIGTLKLTIPVLACMTIWLAVAKGVGYHYFRRNDWELVGSGFSLLLVAVAHLPMIVVIGLCASAARKRTASAILQTFLVCLVWWTLPFVVVIVDDWLNISRRYGSIGGSIYWNAIIVIAAAVILPFLVRRRKFFVVVIAIFLVLIISSASFDWPVTGYRRYGRGIWGFLCISPVGAIFMLMEKHFRVLPCITLIPCWIGLLGILIHRLDKLIGRQ
jgi:ABC-type transport system involved in multi-copper enzyme maturation permease subunit